MEEHGSDNVQGVVYGKNRENWRKYLYDKIVETKILNEKGNGSNNKIKNKDLKYF
jgi:hypothetical protein